jgi:toxin secretion/phage lysis holin
VHRRLTDLLFLCIKIKEREVFAMRDLVNVMQYIFTAIGGAVGWFFGGLDGFLYVLITFMVIDYITGVMVGIAEKKLSSEVGFKGICRKVLIFCLVGMAHILDVHVIQTGNVLRTAVIFFYLSNEGISIIENAARMGLPVPQKMKDVLEQLKDDAETKK